MMEFVQLPDHIESLVEEVERAVKHMPMEEWTAKPAPGTWSRIEELGHLVDSAANNHQRFVRAALEPELNFPGYQQDGHVAVNHYQVAAPPLVLCAWRSLNLLIAHTLRQFPPASTGVLCSIGGGKPIPLSLLAIDYVAHMEHHLRNTVPATAAIGYSGMPYPLPL